MENLQATKCDLHTLKTRSRIVLSLMDRLGLSVSGIEDYHISADRHYTSTELAQELDNWKCKYTGCLFTLCPCCINFLGKTGHISADRHYRSIELAQELDNWKCKYIGCLFTLCPCCVNFFLSSSGSGTGSTQPRDDNWGAISRK
jgi:hypothetical protein